MNERTAQIIFSSNGLPNQEVTITQSGRMGNLTVTPDNINVSADPSMATFEILSDVDWTIKATDSWLAVNPAQGSGNETIEVTIGSNSSNDERIGRITVCSQGLQDRIVTVTQAGAVIPELSVDQTLVLLPAGPAGVHTLTVNSNVDWESISSLSSWFSYDPEEGSAGETQITINYDENPAPTERNGTITFSAAGIQDIVVDIRQELSLIHI